MEEKNEEVRKALSNFFETGIIKDLKASINALPIWMEKGLKLVYPQMQETFLTNILDKASNSCGCYVDNAIEVMEALDKGVSVKKASKLLQDFGNFSKQITTGYVLAWSKRGPEFFRETLSFPIQKLNINVQNELKAIEFNNACYKNEENPELANIDDLKANIKALPEMMERGLKLVDPEVQLHYLEDLIDKVRNGFGIYVNRALQLMEMLENGTTIDEVNELIKDYDSYSKEIIANYILAWSKLGKEFYYSERTSSHR